MNPRRAVIAAVLLALSIPAAAVAQSRGFSLVTLTMNTGTVLIVEVTYEDEKEIKVFNLDTGKSEKFRKSKNFKALNATEAKLLPPKFDVSGKRPDSLEAVQTVELPTDTPDLFKRLGAFPENIAKYLAWAASKVGDGGKVTVAILPIRENRGIMTGETVRRGEELTGTLARHGVEVVERTRLNQVVNELVKQQGALFDNDIAQRIGRQAGASAVIVGTLSPRGERADMNLRLVEVATGEVLAAPSLKDVVGLPRDRVQVAHPGGGRPGPGPGPGPATVMSFGGRWDVKFSGGREAAMNAGPKGVLTVGRGAPGRWDQTGDDLTLLLPKQGTRKSGKQEFTKFLGKLAPRGRAFRADNGEGVTIEGKRP